MQISSKLLYKTAIMLLALLMVTAVFVVISQTKQANAMSSPTEWEIVRGYVNSYLTGAQSGGADEGEAGYMMTQAQLKSAIDSNGDGIYLGVGDDVANAPVLIDNLKAQTNMIPATSYRCMWNADCFEAANVTTVKNLVNAHEAGGFSTNVDDYCVSGHTEAPTTGAWGYIAQTGALGGTSTPKVYAFTWGRNGWTNTLASYTNTGAMAAADAAAGPYSDPTQAQCGGTSDAELVRCAARWSIYASLGNVANGGAPAVVGTAAQTVDVRTGSPATTMSSAGNNIMVPVTTLFNTNRSKVNPTITTTIVTRSPMMGGIVAEGAKMLGYNMLTGGAFINGGIAGWNNLEVGKQASTGVSYATIAVAAYASPGAVDTTNPVITNTTGTGATGSTTADVVRLTDTPATSKIALTGSDAHVVNNNSTILGLTKTTSLTALHPGVTYTGTLTVYDAQANSASTAISFTTTPLCTPGTPSLSLGAPYAHWLSYADYLTGTLAVDWTVNNAVGAVTAYSTVLTNVSNTNGVTQVVPSVALGTIAPGGSATGTLKYGGFVSGGYTVIGSWHTVNSATAKDECGTTYSYGG